MQSRASESRRPRAELQQDTRLGHWPLRCRSTSLLSVLWEVAMKPRYKLTGSIWRPSFFVRPSSALIVSFDTLFWHVGERWYVLRREYE